MAGAAGNGNFGSDCQPCFFDGRFRWIDLEGSRSRCVRERNKANIHHCLERANAKDCRSTCSGYGTCYVWVHHAKCVTQSVGVRIYIGGISRSILWRCGVDYLSGSRNAGQYRQRFCCLSYYYQSGNGDILRLFGWSSNNGSDSGVVPATRCHTICYGTGRCCNQLHVQRWNDISTIFCG